MAGKESELPIFIKTYDFLAWLVPVTNHFPRLHRHTITRRLLDAILDFQEDLLTANTVRDQARLDLLGQADAHLSQVRLYLRLAQQWRWINPGQYEHASRMVAELGKLLGGWQKLTRQQAAGKAVPAGTG